jgi:hypothetical protein
MTTRTKEDVTLTSRLARIEGFIDAYQAYRWRTQQTRLGRMGDFVTAFRKQADRLRKSRPARFNVFSMFKVGTDEVSHSAFLAWLLDARESHRQGNLFLKAFLGACRPKPSLPIPEEYQVQTEFSWTRSRIDILVYQKNNFLLYIENKTGSPDTLDQPDREFEDMRELGAKLGVPPALQVPIYLTPTGRRPPGDHTMEWRTLAYSDVGRAFDDVLSVVTEDKVKFLLNDWLDTIVTFAGLWRQRTMTQFKEESILLAKDWDTVADILQTAEQLENELSELLHSVEGSLYELEWWGKQWVFQKPFRSEAYVSNQDWRVNNEYILRIGVYNFGRNQVFGSGASPPLLYVWARKGYEDLIALLERDLGESEHEVDPANRYLFRKDVQKCLPEMVEEYPELAHRQILDFIDHHAKLLMQFEGTISQYLKNR